MLSKLQTLLVTLVAGVVVLIYVDTRIQPVRSDLLLDRWTQLVRMGNDQALSQLVIYNRIPKTGSTTLTNAIMYDLCRENGFSVIHLNMTRNRYMMSVVDQQRWIVNITSWTQRLPAIYHGHVAFIDFARFGRQNPIYINLVREPLDRLISYYYFLRFGDDYRVGLKRSRAGNNQTFDECIMAKGKDCDPKQMWLQIPYFCGINFFCSEAGNVRALEQAKQNVLRHYLLVGVTEQMRDFIILLEHLLPNFFRGALSHFDQLEPKRTNLRHTNRKIAPSEYTKQRIMKNDIYKMEYEFYDFIRTHFNDIRKKAMSESGDLPLEQQFHYEKIKP